MRNFLSLLAAPAALVITVETAQALSPTEVNKIAKPVTVRLSVRNQSGSAIGSGVIVKREGNTYYVLTSGHVVRDAVEGYLFAPGNLKNGYEINISAAQLVPGVDLAVIQFTSSREYPVAKLGNSDKMAEGSPVFVAGFPDAQYTGNEVRYRFVEGTINTISPNPLEREGYAWQYSNATLAGMSGGGVFNEQGELVGIHGIGVREGRILVQVNKAIPIAIYEEISEEKGLVEIERYNARDNQSEENAETPNNSPESDPNSDAIAYLNRGFQQERVGNFEEAIADFNRAINIDPNYVIAYVNRGATRGKIGQHQEAIADFNRAIELDSESADAYYGRGIEKAELGKHEEAIADFKRVIVLKSYDADAHLNLGLAYEALGNKQEALASFQEAADLYRRQGDGDLYNRLLRRIARLEQELEEN